MRQDVILDTDLGSDCDDMMALAYLVFATHEREACLKAVVHSNGCPEGPDAIRVFFENLGEPVPLIGKAVTKMKAYDHYCKEIVERFDRASDPHTYNDAVTVLRRALTESENAVICAIGAMTNIAALLESKPDAISPLDGVTLVRERCSKLVLMSGSFDSEDERIEWNVRLDISAARTVVMRCPVPIAFLPFETGVHVITGGPVIKAFGESTPLSLSFCRFPGVLQKGGRPSWDPATVLYAVEGCGEYFVETPPGTVAVEDSGKTVYIPNGMGKHRILHICDRDGKGRRQAAVGLAAYIDECTMRIYQKQL